MMRYFPNDTETFLMNLNKETIREVLENIPGCLVWQKIETFVTFFVPAQKGRCVRRSLRTSFSNLKIIFFQFADVYRYWIEF